MHKINQVLCDALQSGQMNRMVFASKRRKSIEYKRVTLRPVSIKGELMYQAEYQFDKKVTHENIPFFEAIDFAMDRVENDFKQINIMTETEDIQVLASKPANPKVVRQKLAQRREAANLSHNRKKRYIIEDGKPCDFLIKLGVMGEDGKVFDKHYSKFRQINRFLEIVDNALDSLPTDRTLRIIDFGCGKSYLTFGLYYYLKVLNDRDVEIVGLDLKEDVIEFCNKTAKQLHYDGLKFLTGDIADYKSDGADMVVTLHACDTATDYALINAVGWNSNVILSVPCCQHQLFSQIDEPVNQPMLKHGIIKDKFTELLTDGLRGLKLEAHGYDVDMIEFTTLEHTAKNIMIRAVKNPDATEAACAKAQREYEALRDMYHVHPEIDSL
ncbi:MAG: SAM-dependent methyltransferase [Eubacterium sp.]|nr:SAM-dependent methyltransferase [Candidatus Colimonas fimequi]